MASANNCVDSMLECSICLNEFTDPRVLPCGHTACLQCLKQHIGRRKSPGKTFLCPYCRHECVVPAGGIDSLVKNYVVTRIKDFLKGEQKKGDADQEDAADAEKTQDQAKKCEQCGPEKPALNAEVFCLDCARYLCIECHQVHEGEEDARGHVAVGVQDLTPGQVEVARAHCNLSVCTKHTGEIMDKYCNTCSTLICVTCSSADHRSHSVEGLAQAALKCKALLDTAKGSASTYRSNLITIRNSFLSTRDTVDEDCNTARVYVDDAVEEFIQRVRLQQTRLQQDITEFQQKAIDDIVASVEKYDNIVDKVDTLLSVSDTLSTDFSHVTRSRLLGKQLDAAQTEPLVTVGWLSETAKRRHDKLPANELIGNLQGNRKVLPSINQSRSRNNDDPDAEMPIRMIPLRFGDAVSGLVLLFGYVHVTHMSNGIIWVYGLDGELESTIKVPQLDSPHGLAVVDAAAGHLAISDYRTKTLHLLTITRGHTILSHTKTNLEFKPEDVNVDGATKELLIAGHSPESLIIMNAKGQLQKTVRLREVRSVRSIVGSLSTGGYVATDQSRRQVIWVTAAGNVLKRYVGAAASQSLGKIFDAVQDRHSRVLVCDYDNSQIHLLSPEGTLVKHMLSPSQNFHKPTCVCLDEGNEVMYVAHDGLAGKVISCFTYDPTPQTDRSRPVVIRRPPPTPVSQLPTSTVHYKMKLQLNTF